MIIFASFFLQNNIISLTLLTNIVHRGSALHLLYINSVRIVSNSVVRQ